MMKLSDYIAKYLADYGVRHIFMVTGGGAMHLNDSFGYEPRIKCIFNHHEQASAMAAEGYSRVTGKIGVINITSGPGSINALNGVFGAWVDSIPMLIISGQVKRETLITTYKIPGLRQIGDQEVDIINMVKGITKYWVQILEPSSIKYHLEKALYLATAGRPGPCWIDIPIDIQASLIDEMSLSCYDSKEDQPKYDIDKLPKMCSEILQRFKFAKRPVIMVGKGVRLANALDIFDEVAKKLSIPIVTAWTGIDIMSSTDPLYCGRPGDLGGRAGNFVIQNSDLLLIIGSRLGIRQTSYNWKSFARCAYKIHVDADRAELEKPFVKVDLPLHYDAQDFLEELNHHINIEGFDSNQHAGWLAWCKSLLERYPAVLTKFRVLKNEYINPYYFVEKLFNNLSSEDVIVCGNGAANVVTYQAAIIKKGQRLLCNTGDASMGYDLPASIGVAIARAGNRVICLAGDGSIQFNLQELQTTVHNNLPIKIFIFNNGGYLSIRLTQSNFFKRFVGESPKSGVTFPDILKIANAYGIPAMAIKGKDFEKTIQYALELPGPVIGDVILDPNQQFEPRISSKQLSDGRIVSAPLEDMCPFLDREEFHGNLMIPAMDD
jgi:acetolactate synthase-1/2/3 large subunit